MDHGFMLDRSHALTFVSQWMRGRPQPPTTWFESLFTGKGIKAPRDGETIPVATFRCQSCGFLESYAREEYAPK